MLLVSALFFNNRYGRARRSLGVVGAAALLDSDE